MQEVLKIDSSVLHNLMAKKEKVTVAYCNSYFGLGISDSRNEAIHNRLKSWIPKSERYTVVIEKVLNFVGIQNARATNEIVQEKHEFEKIYDAPYLRFLRLETCSRVFHKILKQLVKSLELNLVETKEMKNGGKMYVLTIPYENENKARYITVDFFLQSNTLVCECGYMEKTGIACSHIIKVLVCTKRPFLDHAIQPQWKISEDDLFYLVTEREVNKQQKSMRPGPPKRSRRNMLR